MIRFFLVRSIFIEEGLKRDDVAKLIRSSCGSASIDLTEKVAFLNLSSCRRFLSWPWRASPASFQAPKLAMILAANMEWSRVFFDNLIDLSESTTIWSNMDILQIHSVRWCSYEKETFQFLVYISLTYKIYKCIQKNISKTDEVIKELMRYGHPFPGVVTSKCTGADSVDQFWENLLRNLADWDGHPFFLK